MQMAAKLQGRKKKHDESRFYTARKETEETKTKRHVGQREPL